MRIAMLADVYTPRVSGVTHHVRITKRALEARGHEVFVFTFGNLNHQDDEPGVIRSPGLPLGDTAYYFGLRYSRQARCVLANVDVAHVHHPFLSGKLATRYARQHGIPIVFTNHTRYDLYAQSYLPIIPRQVSTSLLRSYLPAFCDQMDSVIAPSRGLKRVLRSLGVKAPIDVIPNGIELSRFRAAPDPQTPIEHGFGRDDLVLVYAGRLAPEKNLGFLLRAFAGALAECENARLLFVGDGPEAKNLRHLARKSGLEPMVRFTGAVPYEEMPRYLRVAQGFATASVTEVLPLSLIEALAAGLPVVGIDSPGVRDLVTDGQNGLLSANDLAAFTAKLARFLIDEDLRKRLCAAARPSAREFDIQRTAHRLENHYSNVCAQSRERAAKPIQAAVTWPRGRVR